MHIPELVSSTEQEILIDGNKIQCHCVDNFNFHEIKISKHLNWNDHFDNISLKLSRVMGVLTRISHFVPIDGRLMFFNSLLLQQNNSSLLIWGHSSKLLVILFLEPCLSY